MFILFLEEIIISSTLVLLLISANGNIEVIIYTKRASSSIQCRYTAALVVFKVQNSSSGCRGHVMMQPSRNAFGTTPIHL